MTRKFLHQRSYINSTKNIIKKSTTDLVSGSSNSSRNLYNSAAEVTWWLSGSNRPNKALVIVEPLRPNGSIRRSRVKDNKPIRVRVGKVILFIKDNKSAHRVISTAVKALMSLKTIKERFLKVIGIIIRTISYVTI